MLVFYCWVGTDGTFALFRVQEFGDIFDYLAVGIAHGRLDLPPSVIGTEAFVINGRHYGYWSPFPALLRLPLALTGSTFWIGHTARISCCLAAILSVIGAMGVFSELEKKLKWRRNQWFAYLFFGSIALGTPLPYLVACPYVYHESILWGAATSTLALWCGLSYLQTQRYLTLVCAVCLAGAAALTRATVGFGALLGVSGLILHSFLFRPLAEEPAGRSKAHSITIVFLTILFYALPFAYNYARFGSFVQLPYQFYLQATPTRMAITQGGKLFQPKNIIPNFRSYFDPDQIDVSSRFPYFKFAAPQIVSGARIEHAENFAGITAWMTGLCFLSLLGLFACERESALWLFLCGGAASLVTILSFTALAHRYEHDLFPMFCLLGASGALWIGRLQSRSYKFARIGIAVILLTGVTQSMAFTYSELIWARWWFSLHPYRLPANRTVIMPPLNGPLKVNPNLRPGPK